jgi:hypothetical protein
MVSPTGGESAACSTDLATVEEEVGQGRSSELGSEEGKDRACLSKRGASMDFVGK